MKNKFLWVSAAIATGFMAQKFYRKFQLSQSRKKVISDKTGNYDLDGVSYDRKEHEVVVSGDATHGSKPSTQYVH